MTLIAFNTSADRAEILTDSMAYTANMRTLGHATKVMPLPHIDAATMASGSVSVSAFWYVAAIAGAHEAPSLDALLPWATGQLREIWAGLDNGKGMQTVSLPTVFLVGYSHDREAFTGFALSHAADFEPRVIEGPFMTPSPTVFRPSVLDLEHYERMAEKHPEVAAALEEWRNAPPLPVPESAEDWVVLAQAARRQRSRWWSRSNLSQHPVGGVLHLTTVERGKVTTEQVHTFDDSGQEFADMITGTAHPQAQLGPCRCGSGKRYIACHLEPLLDKPCTCGSGKTFADCCRVTVDEAEHVA
jgi:hypothetical protein